MAQAAPRSCRITGEVAAHVLTEGHADGAAQVPALLRQVEGDIATVTADGAYDSDAVYQAVAARMSRIATPVTLPVTDLS